MSQSTSPVLLSQTAMTLGVQSLSPIKARDKATIEETREDARRVVAWTIVGCFGLVIGLSFLAFFLRGETPVDDVLKLVQAILAPVVGIVGAVTGFYFSSATVEKTSGGSKP